MNRISYRTWSLPEDIKKHKYLLVKLKNKGYVDYEESPYLFGIAYGFLMFTTNMIEYPIGFIIGDGYSDSFSIMGKGGDYGIVETLFTLGMPFFLIVMYSLSRLIIKSYNFHINRYFYKNAFLLVVFLNI